MISDYFTFFKELPNSFPQIGAMLPSSPYLGRAMLSPVKDYTDRALSILEVGPGTGPFTRQIVKQMRPEDRLLVCEINPRFLNQLKESLKKSPYYIRNQDRVRFFEGPVQALPWLENRNSFDIIVSSLPFAIFEPELVEEIFGLFHQMLAPGGTLSFYEYVGVRRLGSVLSSPRHRRRVKAVDLVIKKWREQVKQTGYVSTKMAFLNVPPAKSIHFHP